MRSKEPKTSANPLSGPRGRALSSGGGGGKPELHRQERPRLARGEGRREPARGEGRRGDRPSAAELDEGSLAEPWQVTLA